MKIAFNTARVLESVPLPDEVGEPFLDAAILDMGSHITRLGFSGDNTPRMRERTVFEKLDSQPDPLRRSRRGVFANDQDPIRDLTFDHAYRRLLCSERADSLSPVMERGNVVDWSGWGLLLQRVHDMLHYSSHAESQESFNSALLISEKALVPISQRQKMAEILFENHRLDALYFALSPVLALYASGLCTGVSVELGHTQSHVVPVFQGLSLFHAIHCLDLGGRDLTNWIALHHYTDQEPLSLRLRDAWGYLKDKYAVTLQHHEAADEWHQNDHPVKDQLPDGSVVQIGDEFGRAAELYFHPTTLPRLSTSEDQFNIREEVKLRTTSTPLGLHQLIAQSINDCDEDLSALFISNIVLSGGASLLRGLPARLEMEVESVTPALPERACVFADAERGDAVFVGGSILASLSTFQNLWIKRSDYEEVGTIAVVRGCF